MRYSLPQGAAARVLLAALALGALALAAAPAAAQSGGPRHRPRAHGRCSSWLIRMLQNFGPHMEQKCACFAPSAGSVSSW